MVGPACPRVSLQRESRTQFYSSFSTQQSPLKPVRREQLRGPSQGSFSSRIKSVEMVCCQWGRGNLQGTTEEGADQHTALLFQNIQGVSPSHSASAECGLAAYHEGVVSVDCWYMIAGWVGTGNWTDV